MYENGSDIHVNGVMYHGVSCLGGGWWIAFLKDDQEMILRIVQEDEQL